MWLKKLAAHPSVWEPCEQRPGKAATAKLRHSLDARFVCDIGDANAAADRHRVSVDEKRIE